MLNTIIHHKDLEAKSIYGGVIGETLSSRKKRSLWPVVKECGIKTIIDVRMESKPTDKLCCRCKQFGIEYFHFPLEGTGNYQKDVSLFSRFCNLIDNGSFYIECANGKYRIYMALCIYWVLYASKKQIKPPYLYGFFRGYDYGMKKLLSRYPLFHAFYNRNMIWNSLIPNMSEKEFAERLWLFNDACFIGSFCEGHGKECDAEFIHNTIVDGMRRFTDARWGWLLRDEFMLRIRLCMNLMSVFQIKYNDWLDEFIDDWGWFSVASEQERDKAYELYLDRYACEYDDLKDKPYYPKCTYHPYSWLHLSVCCESLLKNLLKEAK